MATEGKSNISIVQPATLDPRAIKPQTALNLLLAMVVGLIGGLGVTYAAESLDESAKSADEMKHNFDAAVRNEMARLAPRQHSPTNGDSDKERRCCRPRNRRSPGKWRVCLSQGLIAAAYVGRLSIACYQPALNSNLDRPRQFFRAMISI